MLFKADSKKTPRPRKHHWVEDSSGQFLQAFYRRRSKDSVALARVHNKNKKTQLPERAYITTIYPAGIHLLNSTEQPTEEFNNITDAKRFCERYFDERTK